MTRIVPRQLPRRSAVPFIAGRGDIRARARLERRSIEDAARAGRYEFLEQARRHFGADMVAWPHTRRSGGDVSAAVDAGRRSARPRGHLSPQGDHRSPAARLPAARTAVSTSKERGVAYVDDETNADVAIPRNRVRAELLPDPGGSIQPGDRRRVGSTKRSSRSETWAWLESAAADFENGARDVTVADRSCTISTSRGCTPHRPRFAGS